MLGSAKRLGTKVRSSLAHRTSPGEICANSVGHDFTVPRLFFDPLKKTHPQISRAFLLVVEIRRRDRTAGSLVIFLKVDGRSTDSVASLIVSLQLGL